jgi:quercetin dioxygenase-like cupin family protein
VKSTKKGHFGAMIRRVPVFQQGAPNFKHAIPNIPGKSLVALVVDYAPGGASRSHTHAKSAFIYAYVVSGAIESQVNDGPKRIYRAGESWYETPGAHLAKRCLGIDRARVD